MKIIRQGLVLLLMLVLTACLETSREAPPELANKYGNSVVLYATSWCGYCNKMREFFASQNIEYLEYDIEASAVGEAEFDELGGRGIPLVLVNGRVVEGYAPSAVLELVNNLDDK